MGCPLKSTRKRIDDFKKHPLMVRAYLRAGQKFRESHPFAITTTTYDDVYEWFTRDLFFHSQEEYENNKYTLFDKPDYKSFLEEYFGIDLTL